MSIDPTTTAALSGLGQTPAAGSSAEPQKVRELAQQFEAMLMTQMMREMQKAMADDQEDEEDSFGGSTMTDTGNIAFGDAMSRNGGLGLSDALLGAFQRQLAGKTSGPSSTAGSAFPLGTTSSGIAVPTAGVALPTLDQSQAIASATAATTPAAAAMAGVTGDAPVSSRYGWRQDPFTGAAQFHKGVDIAVAYGQDVKAAAAGTVSFAGVQPGYGNTVVIDHDNGRQTRYGHLSEVSVKAGDSVSEGQVVGKSGNSGRSTGPHLHFEMLVDGRSVDPSRTAVTE